MTVIFPGWSTQQNTVGALTTWHVRCIAKALRGWGVKGGKLDTECLNSIESLLSNGPRQVRGPIEWRLLAETQSGASDALVDTLNSLEALLNRICVAGVEPHVAEALERMVDQLEQVMDDEPCNGRVRLQWICNDIIDRVESVSDDRDTGDFDGRIEEMAALSVLLGFPSAPIQCTVYGRNGTNRITPAVGETWPDPMHWVDLEHRHPEFKYVFGYRLHDPARTMPVDLRLSALVETDDLSKTKLYDPWVGRSSLEARQAIVKYMRRWISAVNGLPIIEKRKQKENTRPMDAPSRYVVEDHVLQALRGAIAKKGPHAKSSVILEDAKLRRVDALAGLRTLRDTGEYKGHTKGAKPRSQR